MVSNKTIVLFPRHYLSFIQMDAAFDTKRKLIECFHNHRMLVEIGKVVAYPLFLEYNLH